MCGPEACFFHLPKTSKLYKQRFTPQVTKEKMKFGFVMKEKKERM